MIPVCHGIAELDQRLTSLRDTYVYLYVAGKGKKWETSVSTEYMNKVHESFVFQPVELPDEDSAVSQLCDRLTHDSVWGCDITQPFKSDPRIRKILANSPVVFDGLLKEEGVYNGYDFAGEAFNRWYENEIGEYKTNVILIGAGGTGKAVAKSISEKIENLALVDIVSRDDLAAEIGNNAKYYKTLAEVPQYDSMLCINASGSDIDLDPILQSSGDNIFVDLRTRDRNMVEKAKVAGWKAYTGVGMSMWIDYPFVEHLEKVSNLKLPTFEEFKKIVLSVESKL